MPASERAIGLLADAEKNRAAGKFSEAKIYYDLVLTESIDAKLRREASNGLVDVLERGGGKDFYVRLLAWLSLAAGCGLAIILIKYGSTVAVPDAYLGSRQETSPLTFGLAAATALSGAIGCFLLFKFAEMLERSALTIAYLATAHHRHS